MFISSLEVILHSGHAEVATLANNFSTKFKSKIPSAIWNLIFGDFTINVLSWASKAHRMLISREIAIVQGNFATGNKCNLNLELLTQVLEEIAHCHRSLNNNLVVDSEALWDGLYLAHKNRIILL